MRNIRALCIDFHLLITKCYCVLYCIHIFLLNTQKTIKYSTYYYLTDSQFKKLISLHSWSLKVSRQKPDLVAIVRCDLIDHTFREQSTSNGTEGTFIHTNPTSVHIRFEKYCSKKSDQHLKMKYKTCVSLLCKNGSQPVTINIRTIPSKFSIKSIQKPPKLRVKVVFICYFPSTFQTI